MFNSFKVLVGLSILAGVSDLAAARPSSVLEKRQSFEKLRYANFYIDQSTCSPSQVDAIKAAIDGAGEMISSMNRHMTSPNNYAYELFLDSSREGNRFKFAKERFQALSVMTDRTGTPNTKTTTLYCDNEAKEKSCKSGAKAFVPTSDAGTSAKTNSNSPDGGKMCLCSTFFDASFPNLYAAVDTCKGKQDASVEVGVLRNQAYTFLHEMTHLNYAVNVPSTGAIDCAYAPGSCKSLATDAPFIALINADNLAYAGLTAFMMDNCGGKQITANTNAGINGDYNPFKLAKCNKDGSGLSSRARGVLMVRAPLDPVGELRV